MAVIVTVVPLILAILVPVGILVPVIICPSKSPEVLLMLVMVLTPFEVVPVMEAPAVIADPTITFPVPANALALIVSEIEFDALLVTMLFAAMKGPVTAAPTASRQPSVVTALAPVFTFVEPVKLTVVEADVVTPVKAVYPAKIVDLDAVQEAFTAQVFLRTQTAL